MRITFSIILALSLGAVQASAQDASATSAAADTLSTAAFQSLTSAIYVVPDLAPGTEWYTTVLGTAPYFEESFYVGFRIGSQELGLIPAESADDHGPGGSIPYWTVENADASFASLIAHGATSHYPVTDVGGGVRVGSVSDPYGNIIGIIESPTAGN